MPQKLRLAPNQREEMLSLRCFPNQESSSLVFFFLKLSLPPGKRKLLPFIIARYLLINDSRMLILEMLKDENGAF